MVISGTLNENDQLPSVRSFAKDAGVNPNTVAKAYQELERNGIIYSVPGRGSFIAKTDNAAFVSAAWADFDNAVCDGFKRGISPDDMKNRIDTLHGKENGK